MARRPSISGRRLARAYHDWTSRLDGSPEAIPAREGYAGPEVNESPDRFCLQPLPRFASYLGFLFGSLAAEGRT